LFNEPIKINYEPECFRTIKNNGHTFLVYGNNESSSNLNGILLVCIKFLNRTF